VDQYKIVHKFFVSFSPSLNLERAGVFIQNEYFLNELIKLMDNHENDDVSSYYIVFSKGGKR